MTEEKYICIECKELKSLSSFHKDITKKNGHRSKCKECIKAYGKRYRLKNNDLIKENKRRDYFSNRRKIIDKATSWNKENKKRRREISLKSSKKIYHERLKYDGDYIEKTRIKALNYYNKNKRKCHKAVNRRLKIRRTTDPEYQASCTARNLLGAVTRYIGERPKGRTHHILGYSAKKLMRHIENNFLPGMNWGNRSEWHIDHIKPVSIFIKEGIKDPSIINALNNLRPIWAKDNLAKGNNYVAVHKEKSRRDSE